MFNPNRLVIARKRRRLSSKELAQRVGLSPITITRLEKSGNPDPSTIESLAKELSFPKDFFYGDDIDLLTKDSASFRSLTAMTAKERDSALAAGSLAYLTSDWISSRFNLPSVDLLDLSHEREPDIAARTLRQYWGLGVQPISNVIKLLESKGIRIFSLSENTRNVDAFSCWRDGIPYIFLNTFKTAERSRFDALHELGHLVLHRHGEAKGREAEKEANKFSSFFLMPSEDILSRAPFVTSLNQLIKAKKRWGVSVSALAYRLHKAGTISDWQYRTFCIQINKRFGITEPNELKREYSVVWEKVFRELWKDGVTRNDLAKELSIPVDEVESLVFGLVGSYNSQNELVNDTKNKPNLRLV
ncbi:XRE family transcriptional regulator [Gammaproteobacteria bacterium AH-315-M22]|nr:XRE family transcriptional regulator [Gammaproteobacteria bacterium AH-315-M22]